MAPWVHTFISPQSERRMCCASREPAQNFRQYIDVSVGEGKYKPMTLAEHWNSDHMRDVRGRMMAGEKLPECEVCDNNPTAAYRNYFDHLFSERKAEVLAQTDSNGRTTVEPVSFDYRISNLCNFKCRMCGDMLSSSWESEMKQHDLVYWDNPKNEWMKEPIRSEMHQFQKTVVVAELERAIDEHRLSEIYWAGGEPLMMEEHWRLMKKIHDLGDAPHVYARYNTNLSQIKYKGIRLYEDLLSDLQSWELCASIDATGKVGEYIRTGLKWDRWLENFKAGLAIQTMPNQMRIDLTMTLPGLITLRELFDLSVELDVQMLSKSTFAFTPDVVMSPMCLPRNVLNDIIDEHLDYMLPRADWKQQSVIDLLQSMKHEPNFEEQWPENHIPGIRKGKGLVLLFERIRDNPTTMEEIMALRSDTKDWWESIEPMSEAEYDKLNIGRGQ